MADETTKTEGQDEKTWEEIIAGLDETAKKAYETHTSGLKSALDKERESAKTKEAEIKTLAAQIKELQSSAGNAEELKSKLAEMNSAIGDRDTKLATAEKVFAVKLAALSAGAHDPEDILKHINMDDVAFANGAIAGINEQITAMKESKPYLFADTVKKSDGANLDAGKSGNSGAC